MFISASFMFLGNIYAQPLNESFDNATFPPSGWTVARVSGSASPGLWERVITGTNPTTTPFSGAGMAYYNSYSWSTGNTSDLSTPSLNFSNGTYTVSFWMYRDNGFDTRTDKVEVYVNTNNASSGGTLLGIINRSRALAPVVNTNNWYQYSFTVPANFNGNSNYIIFKGVSGFGNRMYIDDVAITGSVTTAPPSGITSSANAICLGDSVTLTANGVVGTAYWYSGSCGGSLLGTGNTIKVSPIVPTIYYARNFNNGVFSATCVSKNIAVYEGYNNTFNVSICQGGSYQLPDGSFTSTAGIYLDTLSSFTGCDSIVEINLTTQSTIVTNLNETICDGAFYFFNGQNISQQGAYADTLTAAGNCDSIINLQLSILNLPVTNILDSICDGDTYFFNGNNIVQSGNYADTLISASLCDSIINLELVVVTIPLTIILDSICSGDTLFFNNLPLFVEGDYFDTLTTTLGCDSIVQLQLFINELPEIFIIENAGLLEANNENYISYQWYQDNNILLNEQNPTFLPNGNGFYSVEVIDSNGCRATSAEYEYVSVSINEKTINNHLYLYPNPANNDLTIQAETIIDKLIVYSVDGRIVFNATPSQSSYKLSIESWNSGVYQVVIYVANSNLSTATFLKP